MTDLSTPTAIIILLLLALACAADWIRRLYRERNTALAERDYYRKERNISNKQWFEDARTRDALNERITELEAKLNSAPATEKAIREALVTLGWTPPSE